MLLILVDGNINLLLGMLVEVIIDSFYFNVLFIGFKSCERL